MIEERASMENRSTLRRAKSYPANKTLDDLRQKVHDLLNDRRAGRLELLRAEWVYDLALLTNDFRRWMQRLDQSFDRSH
ncbi:hypothetical protein NMA58_24775 (plasmid) [Rhizobium sp. YTUHZ045]|uniref:hypothetical protein n=1 Tax=Rhizobium sp. YTUHZ045 TaxID=2962888 RepID=UPI003DA975DD